MRCCCSAKQHDIHRGKHYDEPTVFEANRIRFWTLVPLAMAFLLTNEAGALWSTHEATKSRMLQTAIRPTRCRCRGLSTCSTYFSFHAHIANMANHYTPFAACSKHGMTKILLFLGWYPIGYSISLTQRGLVFLGNFTLVYVRMKCIV